MYCKTCGRSLGNDPYIKYCAYCGVELDMPEAPPMPSTYTKAEKSAPIASSYSYSPSDYQPAAVRNEVASTTAPAPSEPKSSLKPMPALSYYDEQAASSTSASGSDYTPTSYSRGMKWFKFLIYFALWIGGIANIITGIIYFSGESDLFEGLYYVINEYDMTSEFESLNTFYGLAMLLLGIFTIVTRFKLAHFKASAPKMLNTVYVASVLILLICYYLTCSWLELDFFELLQEAGVWPSIITSIVMVILNKIYFKKRADLFIK